MMFLQWLQELCQTRCPVDIHYNLFQTIYYHVHMYVLTITYIRITITYVKNIYHVPIMSPMVLHTNVSDWYNVLCLFFVWTRRAVQFDSGKGTKRVLNTPSSYHSGLTGINILFQTNKMFLSQKNPNGVTHYCKHHATPHTHTNVKQTS